MKVVYIASTHFDDSSFIGGTERYAVSLAQHMSSLVDTTLVTFSSSRQSICAGRLKIELYPTGHFIKGYRKNPFNLQFVQSLGGSDIVHNHNLNLFVSDLSCLVGTLLGKAVVVTEHGTWEEPGLKRRLPALTFKWYRKAIAQSAISKNVLPTEIQRKAIVVKGGVDTSKFCPSPCGSRESKILFVGRIVPEKGIRYLVEAFRGLHSRQLRLVIVGRVYNERYYADLLRLSSGLPVTFIHNADDETIIHEYQTASVMVLPSLFRELMGQVVLESQACGTPVICSDAGALQEFVIHGQTGLVVGKASAEEIAEALERLLSLSSKEQADLRGACRDWVQQFDWQRVAEKHLDVYQELLSR